jgi:hypothetical protein
MPIAYLASVFPASLPAINKNRHTTLLGISNLLKPASYKGLRRLAKFRFRPFGIFMGLAEMAVC